MAYPIRQADFNTTPSQQARQRLTADGFRLAAGTTGYRPQPLNAAIVPGAISSPITIKWQADGIVLNLYGSVNVTDPATIDQAMMSIGVRVSMCGVTELFTDGYSPNYAILGTILNRAQNAYYVGQPVKSGDIWTITYKNENASLSILPDCTFDFAELAR